MRLIFRVSHDCPAESGASNPPTFTFHSLPQPIFDILILGDIVSPLRVGRILAMGSSSG